VRLLHVAARLPNGKALLREIDRIDNHHVREAVKRISPRPIEVPEGDELTLAQAMKGPDGGPKYIASLKRSGAQMTLTWKGEDIYCQGIVSENRYEQSATTSAEAWEPIVKTLLCVGFLPPETKKKKKR
jgi:hypothetical protein